MTMNNHIDQDQLALYAMQLLDKDEAAEIATHLTHCEQCRHELGEMQGDLAVFAMVSEVHSPPALARERLMTQVRRERREPSGRSQTLASQGSGGYLGRRGGAGDRGEETPRGTLPGSDTASSMGVLNGGRRRVPEEPVPQRNVVARVLPWAGWAIAAGLAVAAGDLLHERDALRGTVAAQSGEMARLTSDAMAAKQVMDTLTDRSAMRVTLTRSKEAPVPVGRANYLPDKGSLIFVASNMAPLEPYKTYELWLIPADGRDPIAAGTFHPDAQGNASVIMPELPKGVQAKAFGITIEDEGGAQTPTMPIIMAGT